MNNKIKGSIFFLLLSLGIKAQNIYVRSNATGQTSFQISNISKFTFSNGKMIIGNNNGTDSSFDLASLRYLNFTDLTLSTPNLELHTDKVFVFPNPVNDYLNLSIPSFFSNGSTINIFTVEGRLLIKTDLTNNDLHKIDVSLLPTGLYLCNIQNNNNNQIIKFVKQ